MSGVVRKRLVVTGLVQGVGFRPFVATLAAEAGLTGRVKNRADGVVIEAQGSADAMARFAAAVGRAPPPAVVEDVRADALASVAEEGFVIADSDPGGGGRTVVPADVATCGDCLRELADPADRRYGHPFISCACCGPRFTTVRAMPYDRANTTMAGFALCERCTAEYADPADRRRHAQTVACPDCGPRVWYERTGGRVEGNAVRLAKRDIAEGRIVAVKGVGGFHLACDATNDAAVRRLREQKGRGAKPFALMAAGVEMVRRYARLDPADERLLTGPERPIVLLPRRDLPAGPPLSPAVAPGVGTLGFLLPYTPLHHLLAGDRPLVLTSGNLSDEPIVIDNADATAKLAPVADGFLLHDRDIVTPCDDSVARTVAGRPYFVRRSRGYAPLPVPLPGDGPTVLAVGGELKAALGLAVGDRCHLGPHVGDVGSLATLAALGRGADHLAELFRAEPEVLACDAHPGYLSSRWAAEYAEKRGIRLVRVPHHRAHVASLLADAGHPGPLIGVCFDGTGYGDDGAVWGGEVFAADGAGFRRAAHLGYVPLPGGDAAIRKPYRAALAHLWVAGVDWGDALPAVRACPPGERSVLRTQLQARLHCPPTSSVGRLFDAVAALTGVCSEATYEGQPAVELEAACDDGLVEGYPFPLRMTDPLILDPGPVVRAVARDVMAGMPAGVVAARFHAGLAAAVVTVCHAVRDRTGIEAVGLTGGVFQNILLLRQTTTGLNAAGFEVLVHRQVPANDGGLALGQTVLARQAVAAGVD